MFHGDLHAGNVLIDDDGNFSLVDFGITGRLDAAQPAAVDRPLSRLDVATPTAQVSRAIRLLAEHRFRRPKELVLFSKNLLWEIASMMLDSFPPPA